MPRPAFYGLSLLGLTLFTACAPADGRTSDVEEPQGKATLAGAVAYRERIALPPDAMVIVRLEDVSLADAPSTVLAEQIIPTEGAQVPIRYTLRYDPQRLEANHSYAVSARITDAGGRLMWISDTQHRVLTGGAPTTDVPIMLVRVPEKPTP